MVAPLAGSAIPQSIKKSSLLCGNTNFVLREWYRDRRDRGQVTNQLSNYRLHTGLVVEGFTNNFSKNICSKTVFTKQIFLEPKFSDKLLNSER